MSIDGATNTELFWLGVVSLVGTTITGLFAYLSSRSAKRANEAVSNGRQGIAPDDPRLFDLVSEIHRRLAVVEARFDDLIGREQHHPPK